MVFVHRTSASGKSYNPVFAENEWADIIEACHANEVPDTWVADGTCYKDMLINGTNYRIDIIGKNHDDLSDGTGKAPLTFQLHDCYATTYQMNSSNTNVGGWRDCQMRTQTMPALKALLPAEVQAGIRPVNKLTSAGNKSSSIVTTSDELFLLSEIELQGTNDASFPGEGSEYEYWSNIDSSDGRIKLLNGEPIAYKLRSPEDGDNNYFCSIRANGTLMIGVANAFAGVSFCFCF